MADPTRGQDWLLYINNNTVASPNWVLVGGQRNTGLSRTTKKLDATDKNNQGFEEGEAGLRGWSMSFDGLVEIDSGFAQLETIWETNQKKAHVRFVRSDGVTYTGQAVMDDFSIDTPHEEMATASVTFSGTGQLVKA